MKLARYLFILDSHFNLKKILLSKCFIGGSVNQLIYLQKNLTGNSKPRKLKRSHVFTIKVSFGQTSRSVGNSRKVVIIGKLLGTVLV